MACLIRILNISCLEFRDEFRIIKYYYYLLHKFNEIIIRKWGIIIIKRKNI